MAENEDSTLPLIPGYELLRPIGQGGMGVAYLAKQLSLGRLVVIKFLNRDPDHDPQVQAARFRLEAELMAHVSHPNIAMIIDYGISDGRHFLVMEYVEGGDLRRYLDPKKPMGSYRVRNLLGPLVEALQCLHQHGILHRDLKPENILMAGGDTPKVSDFGIAMHSDVNGSPTHSEHFAGTIGYVAPEQQYRLPVDERTDQYSLAALCYELLTGQLPLGAFPLPSQVNSRLHASVDPVIRRALSEDRSDRYPTIRDFGAALDGALAIRRGGHPPYRLVAAAALLAACGSLAVYSSKRTPPLDSTRRAKPAPPASRRQGVVEATVKRPPVSPQPQSRNDVPVEGTLAPDRAPAAPTRSSKPVVKASVRDMVVVNSVGMVLVLIPKGSFLMGSPNIDPYARLDEKPAHRVRIGKAFYLGACEVTVGQFRVFVGATSYQTTAERDGKGGSVYDRQRKESVTKTDLNWRNPGFPRAQADDEPVVQISRADAIAFCEWLTQHEGVLYRLPTEAEWEYACRAGSQTAWSFGDDPSALCDYAWFQSSGGPTTHPVARKLPNAFGLYDMYGNVWEWCKDRYAPSYPSGEVSDPKGPPEGQGHVLRGGSWGSREPVEIRSASRRSELPGFRYYSCGFRVRRATAPPSVNLRSP